MDRSLSVDWRRCLLTLSLSFVAIESVDAQPKEAPHQRRSTIVGTVRAIPPPLLAPKPDDASTAEFVEAYYDSIRQWGRIVANQVRPVPEHANWSYLGLPGHGEDHVRPTAYAAMVLGFLSEFHSPESPMDPQEREQMGAAATALLRYLAASHVTGGKTCLDGKPWGEQWQSAMWARAAGMAGWLLWPKLDQDLQASVAAIVELEANRFVSLAPKDQVRGDTGAEENAWNASVTALACSMMPGHARSRAWSETAKRYMYNTFSVSSDSRCTDRGDDDRPIGEWVTTVNAHDDFTVENHGLVHVGYLKTSAAELQENAVHWLIAGKPVPKACSHHLPEVFSVLLSCMAWDGSPVFFGGNDWKIYHSQNTDIVVYTMMNLLARDSRAAYLERVALDWLRRQQQAEGGYYNVRRDLEYGGLCATRLIACCLAHAAVGTSTKPILASEFERMTSGVRYLPSARAILHRTPNKFASFIWAQKRTALALPREGNWVVWPHFDSHLGLINGEDSSERRARLISIQPDVRTHGFEVRGTLSRCAGQVTQEFFFASPAADYTVYAERLRANQGFRATSRETGVIGLEYPLGSNTVSLSGAFGTRATVGYGGTARKHEWKSPWLNVNDRIGYVVCRSDHQPNVMRYHDESQGVGRVPQLQEWISLAGEEDPRSAMDGTWICVVALMNQTAQQTATMVPQVHLHVDGDHAKCRIGNDSVAISFPP